MTTTEARFYIELPADECGIPLAANPLLGGRRCPQCYRRDREYKPSNLRWERPS